MRWQFFIKNMKSGVHVTTSLIFIKEKLVSSDNIVGKCLKKIKNDTSYNRNNSSYRYSHFQQGTPQTDHSCCLLQFSKGTMSSCLSLYIYVSNQFYALQLIYQFSQYLVDSTITYFQLNFSIGISCQCFDNVCNHVYISKSKKTFFFSLF